MACIKRLFPLLVALPAAAQETVLGVYIFHRHGDRTAKATPPTSLTDLGYQEVMTSGSYYRSRYIDSSAPLYIDGISTDMPNLAQIEISAPSDNVLMNSALGFGQGLYPPVAGSSQTLRNGTVIQAPLNGYQLIPIATVSTGTNSEDSTWLESSTSCYNAEISSNEYFYSSQYDQLLKSTMGFYKGLMPVVNTTFNSSADTYKNAYTIFDYINVAEIHNATIPSSDLLTNETLFQLRTLADQHEFNLAYNASSTIRAIGGMVLAAQVVDFLNSTITEEGKTKLGVQFGNYATMQSYFGLADLTLVNNPNFYGIPDYASSLVWELYTNQTVNNETGTLSDTSNLYVRFLFHNGTASNISEPQLFPLFGQPKIDLSWNDFVQKTSNFSIGSTAAWCTACGNSTGTCSPYAINSSTSSSSTSSSGSSSGISTAVGGVIGALVTLAVILLIEGLILVLGGYRLVSKKRLAATNGATHGSKE